MALAMLTIAARSADYDRAYGHGKTEYFSSGIQGTLILFATQIMVLYPVLPKLLSHIGQEAGTHRVRHQVLPAQCGGVDPS